MRPGVKGAFTSWPAFFGVDIADRDLQHLQRSRPSRRCRCRIQPTTVWVTCNLTVQVDPPPLPPGQICNQGYTVDSTETAPFTGQPRCLDLVPAELMDFESAAGDK